MSVDDDDIGIPNVPAIVWQYEQEQARKLLDAGLCSKHKIPMQIVGNWEVCPICDEEEPF